MQIAIFTPSRYIIYFERKLINEKLNIIFVVEDDGYIINSGGVYHYDKKRDYDYDFLLQFNVDFAIVYGWSTLIPSRIRNEINFFNFHPSLLPKYRGSDPIIHQLFNKETYGGVTLHKMNHKFDSGPIFMQKSFLFAKHETPVKIFFKTFRCILEILNEFIDAYAKNNLDLYEQDESKATYYSSKELKKYLIDENTAYDDFIIINKLKDFMQIKIIINGNVFYLESFSLEKDSNHRSKFWLADRKIYIRCIVPTSEAVQNLLDMI